MAKLFKSKKEKSYYAELETMKNNSMVEIMRVSRA